MESLTLTIRQYQLLTDWYLSAMEGIDDKDGCKSLNDHTNSLEWIAGHLLIGRYNIIQQSGGQIAPSLVVEKFINPALPPPRNTVAFDPKIKYLTLSECREKWVEYSGVFIDTLRGIEETLLNKELPFSILTGGNKMEDALKFLILHETYHIGQMAIFRKALGYNAMLLGWRQ